MSGDGDCKGVPKRLTDKSRGRDQEKTPVDWKMEEKNQNLVALPVTSLLTRRKGEGQRHGSDATVTKRELNPDRNGYPANESGPRLEAVIMALR